MFLFIHQLRMIELDIYRIYSLKSATFKAQVEPNFNTKERNLGSIIYSDWPALYPAPSFFIFLICKNKNNNTPHTATIIE